MLWCLMLLSIPTSKGSTHNGICVEQRYIVQVMTWHANTARSPAFRSRQVGLMQILCLMQARTSLAKQRAQLRQDAKQQQEVQSQEEAHGMYLLVQQMRNKVGLFANMKMHQQSAPDFYSRIMQLTPRTLHGTKFKS